MSTDTSEGWPRISENSIAFNTAILIGGPQDGMAQHIVNGEAYLRVPSAKDLPVHVTFDPITPSAYPCYEVARYCRMPFSEQFPVRTKLIFYLFEGIEE